MRYILLSLLALTLASCTYFNQFVENPTSASPLPPLGEVATFTGEMVGTVDDCAFDGICAAVVNLDGVEINAVWANGMTRCEGELENNLNVGDMLTVRGVVRDSTSVSICPDTSYYIRSAS